MLNELKKRSVHISKVYFCPHHPEFGIGEYKKVCECRKPNPGMILRAKKEFNIDLTNSMLIGDKYSDLEAGIRAGILKVYNINSILK